MCKNLFLLILLISSNCISQRIAIDKIDKFTDDKIFKVDVSQGKIWKGSDKITKGLFNNVFMSTRIVSNKDNRVVLTTLNLQLGSLVCVNPDVGKIILLLSDNTKLTLKQSTSIECESNLDIEYYIGDNNQEIEENLTTLSMKEITSLRVYSTDGYIDFEIKDDKKELIKKHFVIIKVQFLKSS